MRMGKILVSVCLYQKLLKEFSLYLYYSSKSMCKTIEEKTSTQVQDSPILANLSISTIESLKERIEGRNCQPSNPQASLSRKQRIIDAFDSIMGWFQAKGVVRGSPQEWIEVVALENLKRATSQRENVVMASSQLLQRRLKRKMTVTI